MSSGLNRSTSPEVALAETNDAIVGVKIGARNRHDSSGRENTIRGSAITKSGPQVTIFQKLKFGGVGKRLTPAVLKTVRPERVSWVRIPPPPPAILGFTSLGAPRSLARFAREREMPTGLSEDACRRMIEAPRL